MSKAKILVQLDSDPQASVFDGVVAVDAGVDHLFRHAAVSPAQVRELVYGAIFTRGVDDLHRTAIFVGGSDVSAGEEILAKVQAAFFGPMRVSVMLDSNGANTTAAAAVISAAKHCPLAGAQATVLAATGPVGSRVVRLHLPCPPENAPGITSGSTLFYAVDRDDQELMASMQANKRRMMRRAQEAGCAGADQPLAACLAPAGH